MWYESANNAYGRTLNPHHLGRIVGGSSGGEACAISSAASIFGIGSDVGGSIRMPAFFCGIFGHKPTWDIVSNRGQLPAAHGKVNSYLTTGPLCRYATDLVPMFKVLAGEKKAEMLQLDKPVDLRKLKIFYMDDDGGFPFLTNVDSELREAQTGLLQLLKNVHKIKAKKVSLPEMFYSPLIWANRMSSEPETRPFAQELKQGAGEVSPLTEIVKWFVGASDHTLPALGLALVEKFFPKGGDPRFLRKAEDLENRLEELLGEDGVLVYPSHPTPAPYHNQPILRPFNFAYTGVFNVLGNPVTQVPLGKSASGGKWGGVPLGVQVVGAKNRDRNTLALALEIEKLCGGWTIPNDVL